MPHIVLGSHKPAKRKFQTKPKTAPSTVGQMKRGFRPYRP